MLNKTINGYTIKRLLGEGGMAEVWYAETSIGKPAAFKFLKEKFCKDENVTARFENEAHVMVKLNHPNIRQVYDYVTVDERPCIIMEYLEGADLKAIVRDRGRIDSETAARFWNEIVSALAYTHAQGVVHRDIKPSNIFVTADGHIKLLDFGIAKVRDAVSGTQTGQKIGTLVYMSPEQITDSKHVDARTDLYSLAVTFVHLLSGRIPYNAESSSEYAIMNQIVQESVDLTGVPADWQTFLRPYLAKEPGKRPGLQTFSSQPMPGAKVDDHTFVEQATSRVTSNPEPEQTAVDSPRNPCKADPQTPAKNSRKRLPWIIGGAVVALGVISLLFLPKLLESRTIKSCKTVNDYRNYISKYPNGRYKDEALSFIELYVNDSIANAEALKIEAEEREKRRCYEEALSRGMQALEKKEFDEAKTAFASAKNCPYCDTAAVDTWLAKCDTAKLEELVCGVHLLSLQWISWDHFGKVTIEKAENGKYRCVGEQKAKGSSDYLRLDGYITIVSEKHLIFHGSIRSKVSYLNNGKEYCRNGTFHFKATSGRKYWREQSMKGPEGVTDYVDIYFQKWE